MPGAAQPAARAGSSRRVPPVWGVCLGHQALGAVLGARVDRAPELMHGKTSVVGTTAAGLPGPSRAFRGHAVPQPGDRAESLPAELDPIAWSEDGG